MPSRACPVLLRRVFFPFLNGITGPSDVTRVIADIKMYTAEYETAHVKAYNDLGAGSMPTTLGLWRLWNNATTNVTE